MKVNKAVKGFAVEQSDEKKKQGDIANKSNPTNKDIAELLFQILRKLGE